MIRIAHLSDIHIRNYQYHDEYKKGFKNLYCELQKVHPDFIIIAGDTIHTKTQISVELVILLTEFFKTLTKIAPVHVILGQHDWNLRNLNKADIISVIIDRLLINYKIKVYKELEIVPLSNDIHLAILANQYKHKDYKKLIPLLNKNNINIALFHNIVYGAVAENNYVFDSDKNLSMSFFKENFDFGFFGDIHRHQFLDEEKCFAYAGSLFQQNFGEGINKGFLLWDIKGKNDFDVRQIFVEAGQNFYTIDIDDEKNVAIPTNLTIKPHSKVRVRTSFSLDLIQRDQIKEEISKLYVCEEVYFIIISKARENIVVDLNKKDITLTDIFNKNVQKKFLFNYAETKLNLSKKQAQQLVDLHDTIYDNTTIKETRESIWEIEELKFSNFFNYAKNNTILFEELDGVIGILGENKIGKCVDENTEIEIEFDEKEIIEKFGFLPNELKKLENAMKKIITIKQLNNLLQKYKDLNINVNTPYGYKKILACGISSKNSDVIKIITEEKKTLEAAPEHLIKTKNGRFKKIITLSPGQTIQTIDGTDKIQYIELLPDKRDLYDIQVQTVQQYYSNGIVSHNSSIIDILSYAVYGKTMRSTGKAYECINNSFNEADTSIRIKKNGAIYKIERTLGKFIAYQANRRTYSKHTTNFICNDKQCNQDDKTETEKEIIKEFGNFEDFLKTSVFSSENNEASFLSCQPRTRKDIVYKFFNLGFFEDFYSSGKAQLQQKESKLQELQKARNIDIEQFQTKIEKLFKEVKELEEKKKEHEKQKQTMTEVSEYKKMAPLPCSKELREQCPLFEKVRINYEKYKDIKESDIQPKREHKKIEGEIISLHQQIGVLKEKISKAQSAEKQYLTIKKDYELYSLYCKALNRDGMPLEVLKQLLDLLAEEANNILSEVVNFSVQFEIDDIDNINIYIKDEHKHNSSKRKIELTSGMEETVAEIALRIALCNIAQLSKPSIFIIDEKFGTLDAKNFDAVVSIFSYFKNFFKHILVITHDDAIKDVVDHVIEISKDKNGFPTIS